MRYDAIFFDLDNTLLDHTGAETLAQADLCRTHAADLGAVTPDDFLARYRVVNTRLWRDLEAGRCTPADVRLRRFAETLAELGLDPTPAFRMSETYLSDYGHHWQPTVGALAVLSALVGRVPLGVISNGFSDTQQRKLDQLGLRPFFDPALIVLSEDVGHMKPHRPIFDLAADRVAVADRSPRLLYVGDNPTVDIDGAKSAGWDAVWFVHPPGQPRPEPPVADLVCDQLADLLTFVEG